MIRKILVYLLVSLILLAFHLWYFNLSYVNGSELSFISNLIVIDEFSQDENETLQDKFLFINTSYDNQLVPFTGSMGLSGNTPITDRNKLLTLITGLDKINNPQSFVICDIDVSVPTAVDSLFISSLIQNEKYIFPSTLESNFSEYAVNNLTFKPSRYSSYDGTMAKIELWDDEGELCMPYYTYSKIHPNSGKFERYFSSSGFFPRNIFLRNFLNENSLYENNKILTLSEAVNLLSIPDLSAVQEVFKDKIILLGNMEQDRHLILTGEEIPGTVILANCYLSLENGLHIVTWKWMIFGLFTIFILVVLAVKFDKIKDRKFRKPWISKILSFLSYSLVVSFFSLCSILWFSVYFSFLPMAVLYLGYSLRNQFKNTIE